MFTIRLTWPAGRYHATPWGKHVNEGQVEWPPSPWRLLRAFLATGFNKHHWTEVPETARSLIEKLAAAWPSYQLPAGQLGHTRHYMPYIEGKKQNTTKVIDTFVRLEKPTDAMLIRYPVDLDASETQLLEQLLAGLAYLGRAESWVTGELVTMQQNQETDRPWCSPCQNANGPGMQPGFEQVPVLGALQPDQYLHWREQAITQHWQQAQQELEQIAASKGKKNSKAQLTKARQKVEAAYPQDLLACLLQDTADFQQHGWSQPPGTQYQLYLRPTGALENKPPRPARYRTQLQPVEAALINLASDTNRPGATLPSFYRSLPQNDLLHAAIISQLDKVKSDNKKSNCSVLTGKDDQNQVLLHQHQHAHYLPLDLDQDNRLDHVLIYAPMMLDHKAQRAIMRVQRTWTKGQDKPIVVTCVGFGSLEQMRSQIKDKNNHPVPILSHAQTWVSHTPFVPVRYVKKSGKNSIENQVRTELQCRRMSNGQPFPEPSEIQLLPKNELIERKLLRFMHTRTKHGKQPPVDCALGLRICFDQPVCGPIALGYASHYGMGLFAPDQT